MKAGILTYHWLPNFGANLQSLATAYLLKHLDIEPYFINYRPKELEIKYRNTVSERQISAHNKFVDHYLQETDICRSISEVQDLNHRYKFDYLISGSDAVFRLSTKIKRPDINFPNPYWLTFAEKQQKKVYLSASGMGSKYSSLDKKTRQQIVKTLRGSSVLVRDTWTLNQLSKLDKALLIESAIDPVFLFGKLGPFNIPKTTTNHDKYIIINLYKWQKKAKWVKEFVKISNNNGFLVTALSNPEENSIVKHVNQIIPFPLCPIEWYNIIANASAYIGVRFHPIVISVSNQIPFLAFDTYQTSYFNRLSSKTYDLCKRFNNEQYCVTPILRRCLSPQRAFEQMIRNNYSKDKIAKHSDDFFNQLIKIFR